jgi:CheY-like chemotaxis protein
MSDATTVLLIDDDPQYRAYCAQRLHVSSTNYDVVEAATGRSGLDICARQPIDCVVLEIDLPDISGFEVLAKLVPRTYRPENRRDRPDKVPESIPARPRNQERRQCGLQERGGLTNEHLEPTKPRI